MAIELDKSQLVITGVGINTTTLVTSLTKKVGYTSIVSVEIVLTEVQKKEAEEKKKKKEAEEAAKNRCVTWSYNPCNNYAPPLRLLVAISSATVLQLIPTPGLLGKGFLGFAFLSSTKSQDGVKPHLAGSDEVGERKGEPNLDQLKTTT
ncbi:hypothetical protein QQ045_001161 [Rhodiola kirilowii]